MQTEHRFTAVFDRDIRAFDGNPLRTETPFGTPAAISVGDALAKIESLEARLEQIAVVCTDNMAASCNHRMALDFVRQIANG